VRACVRACVYMVELSLFCRTVQINSCSYIYILFHSYRL